MTLRTANNPMLDSVVLNVLAQLLPNDPVTGLPNTVIGQNQVALGSSLVYVQNKYLMSLGQFPAVHLSSGEQHYRIVTRAGYVGLFIAEIEYYDRWDTQPSTIDAIRTNIATDLERMKANIEDQDSLAYQGQAYAISIPEMSLSPYKGEIDTQFPGLTLVYRTLTLHVNLLPYDAA